MNEQKQKAVLEKYKVEIEENNNRFTSRLFVFENSKVAAMQSKPKTEEKAKELLKLNFKIKAGSKNEAKFEERWTFFITKSTDYKYRFQDEFQLAEDFYRWYLNEVFG